MLSLRSRPWCEQFSFAGDRSGKPRSRPIREDDWITAMRSDESMADMIAASLGSLCGLIASGHSAIDLQGDILAPRLAGHPRGGLLEYGDAQIVSGKEWMFAVATGQQLGLMRLNFILLTRQLPGLEVKNERRTGHPL
jgi:hypothetical protein